MKSGLEDRNNARGPALPDCRDRVSMKSGLEDRNNQARSDWRGPRDCGVSMKSGLEDRNNTPHPG